MMIDTATAILAATCSRHIRITHTIAQGNMPRATDLLLERMRGLLDDFQEGDIIDNDELIDALATISSSHGPCIAPALLTAARTECLSIRHS